MRRFRLYSCVIVVFALLVVHASWSTAEVFTFTPSIDLFVDRSAGFAKVDGPQLDIGDGQGGSGQDDRALMKFDFSPISGSAVSSATLRLQQMELGNDDRFGAAQLNRVGTMDWNGTETGATLYSLARDTNSVVISNFSPATNPPSGTKTIDTTATVQGWVDGSLSNFGFGLVQAAEGFTDTQRRFVSGDGGGSAVTVDFTTTPGGPAVASLTPTIDLFIDNSASNAKIDNNQLSVGHGGGGSGPDDRALLKFDVSSLDGATIHRATLTFNQEEQGSSDRFGSAQVRRIGTTDWDGTESGTFLYDLTRDSNSDALTNFSPAVFSPTSEPPSGPYSVDLTDLVQDWLDGTSPNFGLGLVQAAEGFGNTQRTFTSSNASANSPVLSVLFTPAPVPEPTSVAIWSMLGLGLAGFGYYRTRRKK